MTPLDILDALEKAKTAADRNQVLFDGWMKGCTEFFKGVQLALDPYADFGLQKTPLIIEADEQSGDLSWGDFAALAEGLYRRRLSYPAVVEAAERAPPALWNQFYRKILLKNLRPKVTVAAINHFLERLKAGQPEAAHYRIPVFGTMKAAEGSPSEGTWLVDERVKGQHIAAIINPESQSVMVFDEKGNQAADVPGLPRLVAAVSVPLVLDCVRAERTHVFDLIPLVDFKKGHCAMTQKDRHTILSGMAGLFQSESPVLRVIPKVTIDLATSEGRASLAELQLMSRLYFKDPAAPYTTSVNTYWRFQI